MQRWIVVVCSWLTITAGAQDLSRHNWYFGNGGQAIRFNRTDNSPVLVAHPNPLGLGGSATATDQTNANLLFYTNGNQVFDVTNTQMPNGFGLTANLNGNQHVAICPVPGVPNQYYVFTNTANFTSGGTVAVSIVDMGAFGNSVFPAPPIGDVISKNQPFGIAANSRSEAMITIPHANGTDYWLITHENNTDNYTVTHVLPGGTFNHTTFTNLTGSLDISAANFSYDSLAGRIAVTPQTANRNVIILDFDNATGGLSFNQFVFNTAHTAAQALYDTEWSSNSRYLYISRLNDSGTDAQVLQFDLLNPTSSLLPVLPSNVFRSWGLQMAPDSTIYHLYESSAGIFRLGRMTNTDSVATSIAYNPVAFAANPNFNAQQFSSFSPGVDINLTVSFVSSGSCSNTPISFYPTVSPAADSLVWDFGDGNGSNQWSPIHSYQTGSSYTVTVTAFLNGQSASSSGVVNINQFDLQLTLVQDTTACECELPVNNGIPPCPNNTADDFSVTVNIQGGTPASVIWSNGDVGPVLTPDSAGYYYVVVTDGLGCSAYAGVNVREYGLQDQRANIWYFGQNAGIDFNQQPRVAISGPVTSPEGVAVISDRNGNVILSTDGTRVYDRNDNEIPLAVPPGIGGENGSTQSALIIPVPGDETLYYIFTTQEVHGANTYELRYSLYDIKLNSGDGGLAQVNQLLFSRSTERITGNGNWLIAHEYGNNSFRAYRITPTGISNPVISSIGSDYTVTDEGLAQGYMKLGAQNRLMVALSRAVAPSTYQIAALEIFDFVDTTGAVTNFRSIVPTYPTAPAGQIYGIEFALNKFFATIRNSAPGQSTLVEFYFDSLGRPHQIMPPMAAVNEELGAIQLGPDGQLYVAVNNKPYVGTITFNADTTLLSGFIPNGFPLAPGTQSRLGLPNFIQNVGNVVQPAGMQIAGFCEGSPTSFLAFGTDPIDEFEWSFGDGTGSTQSQVEHTYPTVGIPTNYVVSLRVFNRCGLDTTIVQTITIFPPPANPTFLPAGIPQPVLCNGPLTLEATPVTNPDLADLSFLWSTGDTTRTISVSQQSIVSVIITNNVTSCRSSGSILVADNRPIVELGPNQTLCQNTPVFPLNAQNPGTTYAWTINGAPAGTAQTRSVDSSIPGIFEYSVQVTDPITLCTVHDSVTFTFNESPVFTAVPSPTAGCGTLTGQIALTLNTPASTLFTYFVTGPSTSLSDVDRPAGPVLPPFTGLGAGSYGITVTDQISGCTSINVVSINDNAFTISSVIRQNTCDPLVLRVTHTTALPFTYRIINSTTAQVVATGSGSGSPFDTPGVPSGTYIVEMTAGGCLFASPAQTFNQDPVVAITGFTVNPCTNPITVGVTGGTGWLWSGPNIIGSATLQTISANPPQGNQVYNVLVTQAGFCPLDTAVTVFVNNNVVTDFNQTDPCEDQVTLTATATPAGTYTYRWYRNGLLIPGGQSILASLADNGITYRVEVVSSVSGCVFSSTSKTVFVAGDLQITFTTTPPCIGSPFTLTGSSTIPGTAFQWAVNGVDIAGATSSTLTRTTAGLYRLTGTIPGCTEFAEREIILFPVTPGSLPSKALICNNPANPDPNSREVLLDAGAGFQSYQWYQGGVLLTGETNRTLLVTEPGVFGVDLVNSFGCASFDQTDVIEECKPRIVAPTAFRPSSQLTDGGGNTPNKEFGIFSYFVDDTGFQIFIFDRWGGLVFQSNDRQFKWNGGYNNNSSQLLPAGTYTYIVKYRSAYRPEDGPQEKRGGVVLLR
ncbi:MAG: PKD domain-containing protein [Cyclobacteriaceae bacterium]|nr:PKD domain-containing protein [Cyclobacteriaceae bacterium]